MIAVEKEKGTDVALVKNSACGSWALAGLWHRGCMAVKLSQAGSEELLQKVKAA